jgi:hypothetical protein
MIKLANNKFIPLCDGISGTIRSLIIDEHLIKNNDEMPIDLFLDINDPLEHDNVNKEEDDTDGQFDLQDGQ